MSNGPDKRLKKARKKISKKSKQTRKYADKHRGEGTSKVTGEDIQQCWRGVCDEVKNVFTKEKQKDAPDITYKGKTKAKISEETKELVEKNPGMSAYQLLQLKKQAVSGSSKSGIPDEWLNIEGQSEPFTSKKQSPTKKIVTKIDYDNNIA